VEEDEKVYIFKARKNCYRVLRKDGNEEKRGN